ncbi:MAG: glycosyltransferase family 4 protein [Candidatus Yonathbacteria bacterium]|nr:glycosyltransferase family 4 protein [Candidatus Yonathbacteria bacterium]
MKLYYIASARMPHKKAYAIQIAKMCEAFIEEGVDLELIIPKHRGMNEDIKDYYKLRPPLCVTRLPALDFYASGKWGYFLSSLIFTISYSLYLLFKMLQGKRGIIYTIDMDTFSFVAGVFLHMPCFLETHGGKAKTWVNQFFFKYVKGVIVINNVIKKQIAETIAFPEEKMLVWPNGIDLDLFRGVSKDEARNNLALPKDRKIIMYCGRFYGWKGLDVLVDATKEISSDIFVYIVGGTREEFISVARKTDLPENFMFPGEKPYTEIPLWLSAADALLVLGTKYDTQSYYYTSPMKVFEYLAVRRPIVASRTPAILDIVSDKEVIFYEPDNSKDLAQKIAIAVNGSDPVVVKVDFAAKRARDFTWQKRAKDILNFIKKNI